MAEVGIKALSHDVSHRIAVGQVILSLSGACKELIENALDAGATNIEIRLKNSGSDLLEVIDNGHGIREQDLEVLCKPHRTSKIADFSDLAGVSSFGFRGEALSALCSLSSVSLITRHSECTVGYKVSFGRNGCVEEKVPTARQIGTTVTVKDLFHCLPVRRKELEKNLKREFNRLLSVVQSFGIICTGIRISCGNFVFNKKNSLISTNGNSSIRGNISDVFGMKQLSSLVEFEQNAPGEETLSDYGLSVSDLNQSIRISGFVSSSQHGVGRSSTDRQFIFVNGRPCDFSKVARVSNEVYHKFNRSQYPFLALNLEVERDSMDVNVTPDKRTVLLHSERVVLAIVHASLQKLYCRFAGVCPSVGEASLIPLTSQGDKKEPSQGSGTRKRAPSTPEINGPEQDAFVSPRISTTKDYDIDPVAKKKPTMAFSAVTHRNGPPVPDSSSSKLREVILHIQNPPCETSQSTCDVGTKISDPPLKESEDILEDLGKSEEPKSVPSKETYLNEPSQSVSDDLCVPAPRQNSEGWRNIREVKFSLAGLKHRLEHLRTQDLPIDPLLIPRHFYARLAPSENTAAEEELTKCIKKSDFDEMEVLGQFNLGFIIARLKDDLFIVDQHASDEKHTFEKLQRTAVVQTQKLLEYYRPKDIGLTAVGETVIMDNVEIFQKNGFAFKVGEFNSVGQKVKLIGVPVLQGLNFDVQDIEELVAVLTDFPGRMYRPSRVRKIFASRACRKSVMIGTALNMQKMTQILKQLSGLDNPWSCPHGRPTLRHLFNLNCIPSDKSY